MKIVQLILGSLLYGSVAPQNVAPIVFCGIDKKCTVSVNPVSCQTLIEDYTFTGSCCSLIDLPATRGCRVEVGSGGNCLWTPKCGLCDPKNRCNKEFRTDTAEACPVLDYDALAIQAEMAANGAAPNTTCSPTSAPTMTAAEGGPDESGALSVGLLTGMLSLAVSTVYNLL